VFGAIAPQGTDLGLVQLVEQGSQHAAAAYASAFAMAFDELAIVELPPGSESSVDRAQMRALGALYLAADLEPAGIFTAAEGLAALAATGGLRTDLGPVAAMVHQFWRKRNERTTEEDRLEFFGRLFGSAYGGFSAYGANDGFEPLTLDLCEALYQLGDGLHRSPHGGISQQTRIRAAARNLLGNLVSAGGGATPFMAREIMSGLQAAIDILKHPHLQGVFGARDIWGVVNAVNRLAGRSSMGDPQVFMRRGRAGMTLIVWLADAAEALRTYGAPLVVVDHPVIPAAVDWMQASLTISEIQARYSHAPPQESAAGAPNWADLGL